MKRLTVTVTAALFALTGAVWAAPPLAAGTVKKIDKAAASVTLAHGPIENIGMPAMTMGFKVKEPRLLDAIKPGDKVRFQVDYVGGEFVVVHIEAAK